MPRKEFIQMGQTLSTTTSSANRFEIQLAGIADGYGFKLVEFRIWGAKSLDSVVTEAWGVLTRDGGSSPDPFNPDFSNESFLGVANFILDPNGTPTFATSSLVDDNIILTQDIYGYCAQPSHNLTNWFLRFETVKLSSSGEAVANYNAFSVRD